MGQRNAPEFFVAVTLRRDEAGGKLGGHTASSCITTERDGYGPSRSVVTKPGASWGGHTASSCITTERDGDIRHAYTSGRLFHVVRSGDAVVVRLEDGSHSSGATSASLLVRLKLHEPHAWERFVDLYGPLVFRWGQRHGLQDNDAADVMQEVLSAVAASIERFQHADHRGRFRGWLWTITRNKVRDFHRRLQHQISGQELDEYGVSLESLPEEWSDADSKETRNEVRSLVHRALELIRGEFQPRTWEAFWRSVVDGDETHQIAAELGLSQNGVRQAKSRVLRRLRAELGDLET